MSAGFTFSDITALPVLCGLLATTAFVGLLWFVRDLMARRRLMVGMIQELAALELPVMMIDLRSLRVWLSPPLSAWLGLEPGLVLGAEEVIERFAAETDQPRLRQLVARFRSGEAMYGDVEFSVKRPDGTFRQTQLQTFRMTVGGLGPGVVLATAYDLSMTRDVEEERDRLFNLSLDLLAVGDLDGRLVQVNPAWVRVLRWSRDDIMARTILDLVHPDDLADARMANEELRQGIPVRELELRTLCRDGSYRWISWSSFPLIARGTVFTVARDVHDRKAAEAQVERYQQRLRQLANRLATVEERENQRLASILHDTLAQELFAAGAKVALLKYPDRLADPQAVVSEAADIINHATELTRTLTFELFPPALYEVGLDAALEWLCRSFRKTRGLDVAFIQDGEPADLPQDLRLLLYQSARELLANVYKHAGASHVEIAIAYRPHRISVTVDDDGSGFDLPELVEPDEGAAPGGFGLFNIRERLAQLSGTLTTDSSPLGGARVIMAVPAPDVAD